MSEIFNWYEKRYPSDFWQLKQLKKYNISELSFLLPRVWCQLDNGQKLLMCAVYNNDVALAKQLLRPDNLFGINPFWSRQYSTTRSRYALTPTVSSSSSSTSCYGFYHRRLSNTSIIESDPFEHDYNPTMPEYFFSQRIDNMLMHSPFYFSVAQNRPQMCALFIETMKKTMGVEYLSELIKKSELTRLVAIALSNESWEIAGMIIRNVEKPRLVLKFGGMSEFLVQNAQFCVLMLETQVVDAHILLVEAAKRHAHSTTRALLEHMETTGSHASDPTSLIDLYQLVLGASVEMGDQSLYGLIYAKLTKYLDVSRRANAGRKEAKSVLGALTVERIVESIGKVRQMAIEDKVERKEKKLEELARTKGFDLEHYLACSRTPAVSTQLDKTETCQLTTKHRINLIQFLFPRSESCPNENENNIYWSDQESRIRSEIDSLERFFNRSPPKPSPNDNQQKNNRRNIFIHDWAPFYIGEPILIKNRLESDEYEITNRDMIVAAKEAYSELSLHFLIDRVDSFTNNCHLSLLETENELEGNFMEQVFCRLCREKQRDSRFALRRLFLEAIILKNAKMTCTRALVSLFLSDDQVFQYRLTSQFFPMLFFLSKAFRLFTSELDEQRFGELVTWMHSRIFPPTNLELSRDHIDNVLMEYYGHSRSYFKQAKVQFKSEMSLKELARRQFMRSSSSILSTTNNADFLNKINDSFRLFLFFMQELNNIFV